MILLLILLLFCSCASVSEDTSTAVHSGKAAKSATFSNVSDTEADTILLSPMNEGETVRTAFMVKNRSGRTLHIDRIQSGCGCTTATWNRDPIENGEEIEVTLFFNSSGQFGKQFKTIEVWSEEGEMCRIFLATEVRY